MGFIKAVRILHEITNDPKYIGYLEDAIQYKFTFKYAYNTPIQVTPLSQLGWSSTGGSVISVSNPHIHPMGNSIVDEIYYCYQQTHNQYYLERLQDTFNWGLQSYLLKIREMAW